MTKMHLQVEGSDDTAVITARGAVRELAREMGFSVVDQTRIATAVSEIVRNAVQYAREGEISLYVDEAHGKTTLVIEVDDTGPGIDDLERVLRGEAVSEEGFGRGITGSRILMDDFQITSEKGQGTHVRMSKWLD